MPSKPSTSPDCFHKSPKRSTSFSVAAKSNSTLAMFRSLPRDPTGKRIGHQKHTDIGSLALLFSEQCGLQALPRGASSWELVAPRPGHAIVHGGDSLRFASGHALQSCIRQVVPMDVPEDRYAVAYFLRPERERVFEDGEGRWVEAGRWHDEKYEGFERSSSEQAAGSVLTGGVA